MNFRDVEQLSAYLDGQLPPADAKRLEARLVEDADLHHALDELRTTRGVIRRLPLRRAPRSFVLRPSMRRLAAPVPIGFPVLRLASAGATFLFLITIGVNALVPLAVNRLPAAAAPGIGMGGGSGGGAESTAPAATDQALLAAAPTAGPESSAPAPDLQTQAQKNLPAAESPLARSAAPAVALTWQIALVGLAIASGLGAWYLRSSSDRKFRRRWVKK